MDVENLIRILIKLINPLLNRKNYKEGLYEIVSIFQMTFSKISGSNINQTNLIIQ